MGLEHFNTSERVFGWKSSEKRILWINNVWIKLDWYHLPFLSRSSISFLDSVLLLISLPPCVVFILCKMALSNPSLSEALSNISRSYVFLHRSRYTFTIFCWPIRWQRACACRSFCGFQSESYMMTVSAAVKLIPRPPAFVQRRNTNRSESGLQ